MKFFERFEQPAIFGCNACGNTLAHYRSGTVLCVTANSAADVRFGSKAEVKAFNIDVRLYPESGHDSDISQCPLSAISGHGG